MAGAKGDVQGRMNHKAALERGLVGQLRALQAEERALIKALCTIKNAGGGGGGAGADLMLMQSIEQAGLLSLETDTDTARQLPRPSPSPAASAQNVLSQLLDDDSDEDSAED
eukprot:g4521.t1